MPRRPTTGFPTDPAPSPPARRTARGVLAAVSAALWLAAAALVPQPQPASAQSAAEILEQARGRGREFEELKAVLNGPDANMRLATFEAMMQAEDEAIRAMAMDVGLASADVVLQELAFKHAIMALDRLHLTLEPAPGQSKEMTALAKEYIEAKGGTLVLDIGWRDPETGRFQKNKSSANYAGEVNGGTVTFKYYYAEGSLRLRDDATIEGIVGDNHKRKRPQMTARMAIR